MHHLVQILLPRCANDGQPFSSDVWADIKRELTDRFGGLTAYNHAPAEGVWKRGDVKDRDDIIIVEVMTEAIDRPWWVRFRSLLEQRLRQERIVIRSHSIDLL